MSSTATGTMSCTRGEVGNFNSIKVPGQANRALQQSQIMYHMGIDEQYAEASALVGQDDASGASCEFRTGAMIPQKST